MAQQVKLQLRDANISGILDIKDHREFPVAINYQLADLRKIGEPDSNNLWRSGAFSKTAKIPYSKDNQVILEDLHNANVDKSDILASLECELFIDGIPIPDIKTAKVKNINRSGSKGWELDMQLFGDNLEWAKLLEAKMLDEYDFGTDTKPTTFDYTKAEIEDSWTSNFSDDWDIYFPVISYGAWLDAEQIIVEDLRPAIYYRAMLREFFLDIGYQIESTFLDSSTFTDKVFPFIGENFKKPDSFITDNQLYVGGDDLGHTTFPSIIIFPDDTTGNFDDPADNYDTTTGLFTAPESGKYAFDVKLNLRNNNTADRWDVRVEVFNTTTSVSYANQQISIQNNFFGNFDFTTGYVLVNSGETVAVRIRVSNDNFVTELVSLAVGAFDVYWPGTRAGNLRVTPSTEFVAGNTITTKDILPSEVSALDILRGLTHTFNLMYRTDVMNKKVFIEPRDTFFTGEANAKEWTDLIDVRTDYTLSFIADIKRRMNFKYIEDGDDGHIEFRNEFYGKEYGSYEHNFPERFPKGETDSENPLFAATYSFRDVLIAPKVSSTEYVDYVDAPFISMMHTEYFSIPIKSRPERYYTFDPRILSKVNVAQTDSSGNNILMRWEDTTHPTIPTALAIVLSGTVTAPNILYGGTDGLVATYYAKHLETIETGIILTARLYLDADQISQLDLRQLIYFEGPADIKGYWAINKIVDYKPTRDETTKVEFVKIEAIDGVSVDATQDPSEATLGTTPPEIAQPPNVIGPGGGVNPDVDDDFDFSDPREPSTVLQNNTGNQAPPGGGGSALGSRLISRSPRQHVVGDHNNPNSNDRFQIGAGQPLPENAAKVTKDGSFFVAGGEVYSEIPTDDGNASVPVIMTDADDLIRIVQLSDS